MWTVLKAFFSANAVKVMEWAAILAGGAAGVLALFNAGKKAEQVKDLRVVGEEVEKAHAIEDKNRVLPDGAAADKLREEWSR